MEAAVVAKNETTVQAIVEANTEKPRVTVVTNDNINEYVDDKLGVVKETPEAKAEKELAEIEAKKKTDEEIDHPDKEKKGKLNERFSDMAAKRKAAEEKALAKEAEVKTEREARVKAEEQAAALKAKYEPVKTDPDPEPLPTQFTDVGEYAKALKEWTADNTRREDAKKAQEAAAVQEREAAAKAWSERQEAAKKAIPDYEETIKSSSVKVSDQVRDAIIESEVGPQLLHHLAKNPDEAERIGKLTVGQALKAIGRLEATLGGTAKADVKAELKTTVAEISKAPAPITPLKGADSPVVRLSGHDDVPKNMDYETWKKLRLAGKIK